MISLANLMIPEVTPLEQIEIAGKAGFDAVGLCIHPADRLGHSIVHDAAQRRAVKQRLFALGLRVLDVEVFPLLPDVDIPALEPTLETAAELGAQFVLVTGNDTDEARACDHYAALCELAGGFGLRPMLEFISYRPLSTIGQADRWLERARHPAGGLCVDALHLFRSGGTLEDLRAIDAKKIGYAQLCDASSMEPASAFDDKQLLRESRTDRRLPGEGILPLRAFLAALPPGLAISVEAPCEAYGHLPPQTRAELAMRTARPFLDDYA